MERAMETTTWILVAVAIASVLVIAGVLLARRSRLIRVTGRLRQHFGQEYERTVTARGDRATAEGELQRRLDRREALTIRRFTAEEHESFTIRWIELQGRVAQSPTRAVVEAERLFEELLTARGYPANPRESFAAFSVDFPELAQDIRATRRTAVAAFDNKAHMEDCRQAMLRYRRLFAIQLEAAAPDPAPERTTVDAPHANGDGDTASAETADGAPVDEEPRTPVDH
jgi:hypothetical protein